MDKTAEHKEEDDNLMARRRGGAKESDVVVEDNQVADSVEPRDYEAGSGMNALALRGGFGRKVERKCVEGRPV
jgi:hypothetical protein